MLCGFCYKSCLLISPLVNPLIFFLFLSQVVNSLQGALENICDVYCVVQFKILFHFYITMHSHDDIVILFLHDIVNVNYAFDHLMGIVCAFIKVLFWYLVLPLDSHFLRPQELDSYQLLGYCYYYYFQNNIK